MREEGEKGRAAKRGDGRERGREGKAAEGGGEDGIKNKERVKFIFVSYQNNRKKSFTLPASKRSTRSII